MRTHGNIAKNILGEYLKYFKNHFKRTWATIIAMLVTWTKISAIRMFSVTRGNATFMAVTSNNTLCQYRFTVALAYF